MDFEVFVFMSVGSVGSEMNSRHHQQLHRRAFRSFAVLLTRTPRLVCAKIWTAFARTAARFSIRQPFDRTLKCGAALVLAACVAACDKKLPTAGAPLAAESELAAVPHDESEPLAPEPPAEARVITTLVASEGEKPRDAGEIERTFLASENDPAARIAAVQALADVPPAVALSTLNRLYGWERRVDVKMEMLATVGDLDHEQNRDNQFALCLKAIAPAEPSRVRYAAIHLLGELGDPRAHAVLRGLKGDSDRDIRVAAAQVLADLAE
jgi:hypothetical protein